MAKKPKVEITRHQAQAKDAAQRCEQGYTFILRLLPAQPTQKEQGK